VTAYTCPKGHPSTTDDFCDTCGAKIAGSAAEPTASSSCPHCGAPTGGTSRFCEDCGFDHSTGKVPDVVAPATVPQTATTGWTVTVAVDRDYFEDNEIEGVEFPADTPPRTVPLPPPQVRIGRASASKGTRPEIDLTDTDPGVSHSHALLTLNVDGVWLVTDQGSTNGTYLNDEQQPLPAGRTRPLTDGDQVHVGAWTTITLHAPAD
jgi:hypothetical protein